MSKRPHPARQRRFRLTPQAMSPLAAALALAFVCPAGATDYFWGDGAFSNSGLPGGIGIDDTLVIGCWPGGCSSKLLNQDFLNNGSVVVTDNLYFYAANTLTNNWQVSLTGDVGLIDLYGGNWLVNNSGLVKTGGSGSSVITVNSSNSAAAVVDAMTGTIDYRGGQHRFDAGATLMAAAGAGIAFSGGYASFADGVRFTGAGQYTLAGNASFAGAVGAQQLAFTGGGTWTGGDGGSGHATLTSNARWSGDGTFAGQWQTAAGTQLTLEGGGTKWLGYGASLTNHGTLLSSDALRFYAYGTLANNGSLQLDADAGLFETYGGSVLVNNGLLAKVGGSGTSQINVHTVNNGGRIESNSGTLAFTSGNNQFYDGTRFSGSGQVLVNSAALFSGAIDTQNLVLANASWQGGDGSPGSKAMLSGSWTWQGDGTLNGQWHTTAGTTTTLQAGGSKWLGYGAGWLNEGRVDSAEPLRFYAYGSLTNNGQWNLQGDVGFHETYGGSLLVNNGRISKTEGTGLSAIAVALVNNGSIDVETGSIGLPPGFINAGRLTGRGAFVSSLLVNAGQVDVGGASTGTLQIVGNFTQVAGGSTALRLQDAAHSDRLLIQGDATLDGLLNLSCLGGCTYAAGSDVLLIDASGHLSGSFAGVSLAGHDGSAYSLVYDGANADVWLHVNQAMSTPVPEPEKLAMFLAGLGVLGLLGRRRLAREA